MNQSTQKNSAPLIPIRPPPPPPVSSAAASGNRQQQDVTAASSKKLGGMRLTKLLPKRMQKQNAVPVAGVKKSEPPPRPPPPKFATKQPVLIDLLSGSPPSSPSPTLRSQESGFEESPDVWRSWPDSSNSTPMVDWSLGPSTTTTIQANADPWNVEWPAPSSTSSTPSGWADFNEPQQQRQLGEVRSTTMPVISTSIQSTTSSTFYASSTTSSQTVRSTPSMPTIIRPGPAKKPVKKVQEEPVVEDDFSLPFTAPMPSFPPPELPPDVEDASSEPTNFLVVAIYDYESDHPEDLNFKVGDVIEVLSAVNEDWYAGQCGDRVGHFPANFVEPQ